MPEKAYTWSVVNNRQPTVSVLARFSQQLFQKLLDMKSAVLKPEYDPINRMYKIEEGGKKFYLPLKSLEALEKFYDSFVPNSKMNAPSVTHWYNSLSRPEQADILVMKKIG